MSPGKGRQCIQLESYHNLLTATTSKDLPTPAASQHLLPGNIMYGGP